MKERVLSADILDDFKKYLVLQEKSSATVQKYIHDSRLKYVESQQDEFSLIQLLKENNYTKIHIDENCIVGWAEKYYRENPQARKSDFIGDNTGKVNIIGEIREPNKFKDYIYPYDGKDNVRFQYFMDKLNDTIQKKNLGAFYTPKLYVDKSIELVREAISSFISLENTFVVKEMKKEVRGAVSNDLGNAFIWSAFKYYLRQPTDSYIVYSHVKYWKSQHLINKEFIKGYAFNRRHFHTHTDACIMCALWSNIDKEMTSLNITGYDIIGNDQLSEPIELSVDRVYELYSARYYDKNCFDNASYDGILVGLNGLEADSSVKRRIKPLYSKDMLGYLVADSVGFDNPDAKSYEKFLWN